MLRKILFGFLSVIIIFAVIFFFSELNQKATIKGSLSERSQEFIENQKISTRSSILKEVDLTGPTGEDTRDKRIGRDNCYSFIIPYRVAIKRFDDASGNICYGRFTFDSPKGAIVAYITPKIVSSWEDIPAVIQRRRDTDEYYPEEQKNLGGKNFIMFRLKDGSYEKHAFYYSPDYFFVFNLITKTNENLDRDLDKMLSSLEIE